MPPRRLQAMLRVLLLLAVVVFLPASNVLLLMRPEFIAFEYRREAVPDSEIYDPPERLRLSQATVDYINGDDARLLQEGRHISQLRYLGQPVYNERELQHLYDVKAVVRGLRWAWRAALFILLGGLALSIWRPGWRRPYASGTFLGGVLLVGLIGAIVLVALLSFDAFFVRFHQVFFAPGTWTFYYEDSLIQFYPLQFWMDATYIIGGASLIQGLLVAGLSYAYLGRVRQKP
ncbi:MAG: TIGR01906 family membrane protein [Anaerolineae bacterium]